MTRVVIDDMPISTLDVLIEATGSAVLQYRIDANADSEPVFQRRLRRYLRDLVTGLNLPIRFHLEIPEEKSTDDMKLKPVQLRIDGRTSRLPIADMSGIKNGGDLARFIAEAVIEDREKLITEQLIGSLWPKVSKKADAPETPYPVRLREFLFSMVRCGQSLSKLPTLLEMMSGTSGSTPQFASFDEAIRAPQQIGLGIRIGANHVKSVLPLLAPRLSMLRRSLFEDLGIILPKIKVDADEKLGSNEIRFRLNDLLFPPEEVISELPTESIVQRLDRAIRDHAELFLTTYCIDNLRTSSPQLVEATCQRIGMPTLLRVLEGILMEGLSIRDLRGICESLLAVDSIMAVDEGKLIVFFPPITNICVVPQEKPLEDIDDTDYLRCVRMAMKAHFSAHHAPNGNMVVYLVDPQLEQRITATDVPLTEEERRNLLDAVEAEIGSVVPTAQRVPILTTAQSRRQLWMLIEREFHRYPVLTYSELSPDINIQPLARISTS